MLNLRGGMIQKYLLFLRAILIQHVKINPLCAEFFIENIKMYLQFDIIPPH